LINGEIEVSINKAATTSPRQLIYFSNTWDSDLAWLYDPTSNNASGGIEWFAAPASKNLPTCDIENITLALGFVDAQARAEPYVLTFTMASSSYFKPSWAILVELSATVSALASAELCAVELKNAEQLAVADTLAFTVTSVDAYGICILDVAALSYSATIASEMLDYAVPCIVAYGVGSDKHGGTCILPARTGRIRLDSPRLGRRTSRQPNLQRSYGPLFGGLLLGWRRVRSVFKSCHLY
jgi:hypothetical protein